MSPVPDTHRFLYGKSPYRASRRIWVLSGQIHDWFFHDLLNGCVDLRRSLELWALREGIALTVTLDRDGRLDFGGNPDPAAAEARFEGQRPRRRPKYGQSWQNTEPAPAAETPDNTTAEQTRQTAADTHQAAGGASQGLLNTLARLTQFLQTSPAPGLIILEDFGGLLETCQADPQQAGMARELIRTARDWHRHLIHNHLLVFLADDETPLQHLYPRAHYRKVRWQTLEGPGDSEIRAALERFAWRRSVPLSQPGSIAKGLVSYGNLSTALGRIIQVLKNGAPELTLARILDLPPINETALAQAKSELEALTGLEEVKAKLQRLEARARLLRQRLMDGEPPPEETLHMIFTGNPGTGKTTVARLVARFLHALGWLRRDEVRELTASAVMSSHVGETRENMQRFLEDARGGVLFIDEAHQFGDRESPTAREAIQALVPAAWNWRAEMIIILAGYAQRMPDFFAMDEGLARRFPTHGRLEFADYTESELWTMLERRLAAEGLRLAAEAQPRLRRILARRLQRGGFGNAGGIDNLLAEIRENHLQGPAADSPLLTLADLPPLVRRDPQALQRALAKLDALYGLQPVRDQIERIRTTLEYDLEHEEYGQGAAEVQLHPGNMLFTGPPGTGKTTVARLMGELLFGIGCIRRPVTLVATRQSLVGRYQGHTAERVREAVEQARDGVLFIDEAYALFQGEGDSYGREAISALAAQITAPENLGTVFILAGYGDALQGLLASDPGLGSRFQRVIHFPAFNPGDCMALARHLLTAGQYDWEDGMIQHIGELAAQALVTQGDAYGSARWVNGLVAQALERMKSRVQQEGIPVDDPRRRRLTLADLPAVIHHRPIGIRRPRPVTASGADEGGEP